METDRNILFTAADALNRTTAAIGSFIDSKVAVSGLMFLEESLQEIDVKLHEASIFLSDGWEDIEHNRARLYAISIFRESYDKFRESAIRLDDWRIANLGSDILDADNSEIGMDFILVVGEFDKRFAFFFNRVNGSSDTGIGMEKKCLNGLTAKLSKYIYGIEDYYLERAILHNDFPIFRGS